jgi:hypothetical protein
MAAKAETSITQACIRYIKDAGGDAFHVHGSMYQRANEPDIDGSFPTSDRGWLHLKIEVKTLDGKPTPAQVHRLREYAKRGYVTGIVTSVEDLKEVIANAPKEAVWTRSGYLQV